MTITDTPLRIGVAGLGTVGGGVLKILAAHAETLALRAGRPLRLVAVSARNRAKERGVDLAGVDWEDDPVALARRTDLDLVVEVIGGSDGPAKAATEASWMKLGVPESMLVFSLRNRRTASVSPTT